MDSEKFSIMWYAPEPGMVDLHIEADGTTCVGGSMVSKGLMTKSEAEVFAQTLKANERIIGWVEGSCQSVFEFWSPYDGYVKEIPTGEKPPIGRRAAIEATMKKRKEEG